MTETANHWRIEGVQWGHLGPWPYPGGVFRLLNMGKNGDTRQQRPHVTL